MKGLDEKANVMDIIRDHENRVAAIEFALQWLPRVILAVTCAFKIRDAYKKTKKDSSRVSETLEVLREKFNKISENA